MTDPESRVESFLDAFFGPGNLIWPGRDPGHPAAPAIAPTLGVLEHRDSPAILPRRMPANRELSAYVVVWNPSDSLLVAEYLTAFLGPSYTDFDGRHATLRPGDPVERALAQFASGAAVFRLRAPGGLGGQAWHALELFRTVTRAGPVREVVHGRPLGRLLAQFDAALAAGDSTASAGLLDLLASNGGLGAANLAHLRIKRLAKLGRDGELLRLPGLADVVAARPPISVQDAVLTAIFNTTISAFFDADDVTGAINAVRSAQPVPSPFGNLASIGPESLVVLGLRALADNDSLAAAAVLAKAQVSVPNLWALLDKRVRHLVESKANGDRARLDPAGSTRPGPTSRVDEKSVPEVEVETVPHVRSWTGWATACNSDAVAVPVPGDDVWSLWPPPVDEDQLLAAALLDLRDEAAGRAWSLVGAFVEADAYERPAALSAGAFIENALAFNRFSPGDLSALVSLLEIVLRSAPERLAYTRLLEDVQDGSAQWVSSDRASVVLDIADLLVRAPCPDPESRLRLSQSLLAPLAARRGRLDTDQVWFARRLTSELDAEIDWSLSGEQQHDQSLPAPAKLRVLLYSLDEAVLTRVRDALSEWLPDLDVRQSHAMVGSGRLKQHCATAQLIVIATRCAKHAATGFIRSNATHGAVICEADGSGSASMIRAVTQGLRDIVGADAVA